MNIIFLFSGLILGIILTWLWTKTRPTKLPDELILKTELLTKELETKQIALGVEIEKSRQLSLQLDEIKTELQSQRNLANQLNASLSARNVEYQNLAEKLKTHQDEVDNLQKEIYRAVSKPG